MSNNKKNKISTFSKLANTISTFSKLGSILMNIYMETPALDSLSWTNLQSPASMLLGEYHLSATCYGKRGFFSRLQWELWL